MKDRIPLQIIDNRLTLAAVIDCDSLRIHKKLVQFVVDTGSQASFLSPKEAQRLQIALQEKKRSGEVELAGSLFHQVDLPETKFTLLSDHRTPVVIKVKISALRTPKTKEEKILQASTLPSLLGIDFLRQTKLSLHVIMHEEMAYLECDE